MQQRVSIPVISQILTDSYGWLPITRSLHWQKAVNFSGVDKTIPLLYFGDLVEFC